MSNGWTPERRARQAALIRASKPWEKSTGPKTEAGKAIVARNYTKSRRHRLVHWMPAFELAVQFRNLDALLTLIALVVDEKPHGPSDRR